MGLKYLATLLNFLISLITLLMAFNNYSSNRLLTFGISSVSKEGDPKT